jgi:hypothetical protein
MCWIVFYRRRINPSTVCLLNSRPRSSPPHSSRAACPPGPDRDARGGGPDHDLSFQEISNSYHSPRTAGDLSKGNYLAHPQFFVQVGVQGGGIWILRLGGCLSFHETSPLYSAGRGLRGPPPSRKPNQITFPTNFPGTGPIQWKDHRLRMMIQIPPP